MSKIIVTGGMGYIGSHTVVDLIEKGYEVLILDDLSRSSERVLDGIEKITKKKPQFYKVNVCDKKELEKVFKAEQFIHGIIHFAAYKYVDESVLNPMMYYRNNLVGLMNMLELTKEYKIPNFIFSSSCSVYGIIDSLPVSETTKLNPPLCPYASTKLLGEMMIEDSKIEVDSRFISLRYFNPVGAHMSGFIGESPTVIPPNLVPRITGTAIGRFEKLKIFGHNLSTRDGTCIRDYIHIEDLAEGHTAALKYLESKKEIHTHEIINLGSGEGVTVLELIAAFEKISGITLNKEFVSTRPGDVPAIYSDCMKANRILNWHPKKSIEDMMISAWNWEQSNN